MRGAALGLAWLLVGCSSPAPPSAPAPTPERVAAPAPRPVPSPDAASVEGGTPSPQAQALPDPKEVATKPGGLENGDFVPEMVLEDLLNGGTYTLSNHLGPSATEPTRAAVIAFVASWCGPCRASLPTLAELKRAHGADLQIVLVAADKDRAGREKEAAHVRAAQVDAVVLDPTPDVLRAYRGRRANVPQFFIVNKIGEVLVQDRGFGKKVKPMLPKQVAYALAHPEYVERKKRKKRKK
jgi:cytochrome c biogenesis protein CcmG/thiol:disulfide interchange protein DsbE